MTDELKTKKEMILSTARSMGIQRWTTAEIDQLRRKLLAEHGEHGKTGNDYIADVLQEDGLESAAHRTGRGRGALRGRI